MRIILDIVPGDDHDDCDEKNSVPLSTLANEYRDEIFSIVSCLPKFINSDHEVELKLERFRHLIDFFLEQPMLLDRSAQGIFKKLLSYIKLLDENNIQMERETITAFIFLSHFIKVRGFKANLQYFPHEVTFMERVLFTLENYTLSTDCIEIGYVLLLWMNILCQNPFELQKFDKVSPNTQNYAERILNVVRPFLYLPVNKCHRPSAMLVATILTRVDIHRSMLKSEVSTACRKIASESFLSSSNANLIGNLHLLVAVFKQGRREDLLHLASDVLEVVLNLLRLDQSLMDLMLIKLIVKLIQRLGMVFLKPKIATWRYSRGSRVLAFDQIIPSSEDIKMNTDEESEDMDYDIPESELEAILQVILRALHDRNTEVRWSAAKGIGRVASRLPKSLTQDVINSILASNFSRLSGNNSWHGGCLAIAELSRRGFLLPECLSDVVNIICEALVFEERQGRHAQGANVRDAACYICWALARAFHPSDMKPHIAKLASALICTSLFDREINVRRAASAAFQENVGRQGTFPEGIPILTLIDYFSVGLRLRSYLDISVRVAAYKPYAQSIIEHLFLHKIFHWDEEIRDLAAEAVRRLACVDPDFVMEKLITIVVPRLKDPTPIVRQGAIYAFSGGCRGLFDCGFRLAHIIEKTVVDIPRENFALCATKVCAIGGELIRRSMVKFVKYASAVVPSAMIPIMEWLDVIELNCCDENGMLRKDMTEAAAEFFKFFVSSEEAEVLVMRSRTKYIRQVLSAESEPIRECGAALLSVLPVEILVSVDPTTHRSLADDAIEALILVTSSHGDIDALWASGRCACVTAIARIACKLGSGCMDARIIECASNALNDYTTDSHGDVGRILREGAMRALSKLIPLAARAAVDLSEAVDEAICKMVQQSCEKIDATRECAANVIRELLLDNCVHLVEKETLFAVYGSESEDYDKHFQGPSCFVYLAPLLLSKHYRYSALSGFVISAGGITESTQRDATDALLTSLSKIVSDSRELEAFLRCLSLIFSNNARVSRITIPLLCTLDHILSSQLLACLESNPDASPSLVRIAELAAAETASKSQTAKIRAGVMVMCNFLHFNYDSHVYRKAAAVVVRCLLSPIPRIRQITAERLYECLLADSSEGDESGRDSVLHLLAGTEWQSTSDKESIHDAACFVNRFLSVH